MFSIQKPMGICIPSWVVSSFAVLTLIVMQGSVQGADYYVAPDGSDNNNGSIAAPWKTINYAVNRTPPVQAGDTVYVRGGTYRETANIKISGSKGLTFAVKNYPNENPVICGSDILTSWTQCQSNDAGLTVNGVVNPHYANIYWVDIDASMIVDPNYLILFEDGRFAYIAQQPNQSSSVNQNTSEYFDMPSENVGQRAYIIDTSLTQSDGYWDNAGIWIWGVGNNIWKRTITSFTAVDHKMILDSNFPYDFRDRDLYALVNHPHILDKAGEYYHYKDDVNNTYRIYYWPENTANLANNISLGVRNAAFTSNGSYVTIDGFTITMLAAPFSDTRSGGVVCAAEWNHSNLTVKNCNINNSMVEHAIYVASGTNDIIENNIINNIKEGRGIGDYYSTTPIIRNNDVNNTGLTSIFFQVVDKGQIIENTVGAAGVHGNGISVYHNSTDVLVARNIVLGANFAASIQASRNITFYGNIFEGGDSKTFVNNGSMTGNVYILNNIIVGNNGQNNGLYNGNTGNWVIKNNIIQGYLGGDTATEAGWGQHTHNLYTAYSWNQEYPFAVKHWRLNKGEYKVAEYAVFKLAGNNDYTLKIDSVAIDAGVDISDIISSLQSSFPDFDFYKDIAGNPVQGVRDIGPYESTYGKVGTVINMDFRDFAEFAVNWFHNECSVSNNWCNGADINYSNSVNIEDMLRFVKYWLMKDTLSLTVELTLDKLWMYQNLPGSNDSRLAANVSIIDDIFHNSSYSYRWEFILPPDVNIEPAIITGGGGNDTSWVFSANSCEQLGSFSDSGSEFIIKVTIIGNDYNNFVTVKSLFGIALLGDVNNDAIVDTVDRSITDTFWQNGYMEGFTLHDCDVDSDGTVDMVDRFIVTAIILNTLCKNKTNTPCLLR